MTHIALDKNQLIEQESCVFLIVYPTVADELHETRKAADTWKQVNRSLQSVDDFERIFSERLVDICLNKKW